jgi:hypothetical protein
MMENESMITLEESVREAEKVFWSCRTAAQNPNDVDFPSLSLYRHVIHMADGVEVLCSASAVVAATPLLRSMLETLFSLTYIHQEDYEQRSLCWLCAYIHQEIQSKEKVTLGTEQGDRFYLKAKEQLPDFPEPRSDSQADLQESIEDLKVEKMIGRSRIH